MILKDQGDDMTISTIQNDHAAIVGYAALPRDANHVDRMRVAAVSMRHDLSRQLRQDPRAEGLPEDLGEAFEVLLADRAAMRAAGEEMPSAEAVAEAWLRVALTRVSGLNERAALRVLDLFRPTIARLTQRAEKAERDLAAEETAHAMTRESVRALEHQAHMRTQERDDARADAVRVAAEGRESARLAGDQRRADNVEVMALRARVAELEARPEPSADMVERLAEVYADAVLCDGEPFGPQIGIRAVLHALAAMGDEAWPSDDDVALALIANGGQEHPNAAARIALYACRSRLAPVLAAKDALALERLLVAADALERAQNAEVKLAGLETDLDRTEDTLLAVVDVTTSEIMPAIAEQLDPATVAKGEALAKSLPQIREGIAERRNRRLAGTTLTDALAEEQIKQRVAEAVEEEREACCDIARSIYQGNTEIPVKDTAAWYACAEFIDAEIGGRS